MNDWGTEGWLYDTSPESRMWRHVLIRSAIDAAYGKPSLKMDILNWIKDEDGSGDFDTVCHYAAAKPEFFAQAIFDILSAPRAAAIIMAEKIKSVILSKDGDDIPNDQQRATLPERQDHPEPPP